MSHSSTTPLPREAIHWILFDFGGVLAEEGFRNALADLSECYGRSRDALPNLAMDAIYDSGYVTGHAGEEAFWGLVRQRFAFTEDETEISAEILRRFILRRPMLRLVDTLRKLGYKTAILSDQTDWLEQLDRRDHFFCRFDRIFNSYHLGRGKRDPTLFDEVIAELTIKPSQAIFIDDNPENVRRAVLRGLHGVLYEDTGRLTQTLASLLDIPAGELAQKSEEACPEHTE